MDAFTLKGGLYTLTTLHLKNPDLTAIDKQLNTTAQQAPKFFDNTPVVIDLQEVDQAINITPLINCLRAHKLVVVGVRTGNAAQKESCLQANLAIMPETHKPSETTGNHTKPLGANANGNQHPTTNGENTRVVTQPVRSGQQVYAQGGDLIILAPVSVGAEILADGHIHVYAPLRGRALAGVQGNLQARIFCQQLEAELIAIAGHYKVSEQLKDQISAWGKSAMVHLEQDHLVVQTLGM